MKKKVVKKRSLVISIGVLCLCVAALIGGTFAWFTDTASTGVNKIQSGNLDVDLVYADGGASATGDTLSWIKAEGAAENEAVLWEPGCTYKLPALQVKNNGNLALTYTVKVTGVTGDAKLLEAIEFTVQQGTADAVALNDFSGTLTTNGETSESFTIIGHMKEDAGNEYKNLTLEGIAITVYATQAQSESDSFNNTYDAAAIDALADLYPVTATANVTDSGATLTDSTSGLNVVVPKDAIADGATSVSISVAATNDTPSTVTVGDNNTALNFEIKASGIKSDNTTPITVKIYIGKGLSFANANAVAIKHVKSATETEDLTGTYDSSTGFLTFNTTSFSPFTVITQDNILASYGTGTGLTYCTTADAVADAVLAAGDTLTLYKDVTLAKTSKQTANWTLNLNGHKLAANGVRAIWQQEGTLTVTGNGTISATGSIGATSSVIRVGDDNGTAAGLVLGKNATVTSDACYGITYFGKDNQTVEINGTVSVTGTACAISGNGTSTNGAATVTVNGKIKATQDNAIYNPQAGSLTINGEVDGGIEVKSGVATVIGENAVVKAREGVNATHTANLNGSSTQGYAVAFAMNSGYIDGGSVLISAGTITGPVAVVNDNDGAIDKTKLLITGGTFSVDPSVYVAGWCKASQSGSTWTVGVQSVYENAVAVRYFGSGYTSYTTLADATSSLNEGDIIYLLKDSSGAGIGTFGTGTSFTIDFLGHTYNVTGSAVGSTGTKTQGFHLEGGKNVTLKNGTITSTADSGVKMLVQNYCNLTLSNITLDGSNLDAPSSATFPYYTLSNNDWKNVQTTTTLMAGTKIIAKTATDRSCYAFDADNAKVVVKAGATYTGETQISNGGSIN